MAKGTKISLYEDGPYLVTGSFQLVDADGEEFSIKKETIALCRCGASTKKPLCDGTHSEIGFRDAERVASE